MGGQDCDGSTLPQAPIGSRPIRSDGLPCPSPTDDDRQISSEDRRSVKLRVRPPPAGTHQCHRATSAGSGMMLTVKLSEIGSTGPPHARFTTGSSPSSWGSVSSIRLNLAIPSRRWRAYQATDTALGCVRALKAFGLSGPKGGGTKQVAPEARSALVSWPLRLPSPRRACRP